MVEINDLDQLTLLLERPKPFFNDLKKNTSIIREEMSLTQAFNRLYNNKVRIEIRQNISILSYYEAFEKSSDQENKEIYATVLKIFEMAVKIEKAIQKQRLLHETAVNEIVRVHERVNMSRKLLESIGFKAYLRRDDNEENLVLLDPSNKSIEKCREILKEIKSNQEWLVNLFNYSSHDMILLSKLFGSKINIMSLDIGQSELKYLKEEMDVFEERVSNLKMERISAEKKLNLVKAKFEEVYKSMSKLEEDASKIESELGLHESSLRETMENISVTLQDQNSLNSLEQIKSNLERQIDSEKTKFEAIKNEIRRLSTKKIELESDESICRHEIDRKEVLIESAREAYETGKCFYEKLVSHLNEQKEAAISDRSEVNIEEIIRKMQAIGVTITEEEMPAFKVNYHSFVQNFNLFVQEVFDLEYISNKITLQFEKIVSDFEVFGRLQIETIRLAQNEDISQKIWTLFQHYYYNQDKSLGRDNSDSDEDTLKKIVIKAMSRNDAKNAKVQDSFDLIFRHESVRRLLRNIEHNQNRKRDYAAIIIDNMEEEIDGLLESLQYKIEKLNEENKEAVEGNTKDEKIKDVDEMRNLQEVKRGEKTRILTNAGQIRKIIGCLNEMVKEVRENYFEAKLKCSLNEFFNMFDKEMNPQLAILFNSFRSSTNNPIQVENDDSNDIPDIN